ncbi:hypothetical protein [Arthrobacter mobilis]|uniref:Uncharacterized protein n=1 Tax=Arthrobacter mobilis TaxID=2724944 RepID=A0A7X6HEQ9_9MICC|nr:hypothetical protein [Arthrobacter mobilis]NKX55812.1 hypothetical protein [Arthrobacter mobilis]
MTDAPSMTVGRLLRTPRKQLDRLFQSSVPGRIPAGDCEGTLIVAPGSAAGAAAAGLIRLIVWKGKVFDPGSETVRNKVGPLGTLAVRAEVYYGPSRLDTNPAIILDYRRTSWIARWIRDEIREVAPGVFLGFAYWNRFRVLRFVLAVPQHFGP